jgi:hypothetical protein
MRRVVIVLLALAVLLPSCRKEGKSTLQPKREGTAVLPEDEKGKKEDTRIDLRPKTPFFMLRSTLGDTLNPKGEVESDNTAIHAGTPVYLTLYLKESPRGLQTAAVWYKGDKAMLKEVKPAGGAKVLTFTLDGKKLEPGKYRVIGYWGGNVAADKQFEILPRAKK